MVLLVYELLIIGIPPTAIPSSIYTLYETLNGVDPIEVPSASFIRRCSTVVQLVRETILVCKLADGRTVGKQGGASQWESWVVLLVCELLIISIPTTAIPISIYTLYETLTGVGTTEMLSVSFFRRCRTVVQVVGETIAAWKLADADSWR